MSQPLPQPLLDAKQTVPGEVREVVERLRERGFKAFLVGGCVRDVLRGAHPKDFDLATSARPEQVQRAFSKVIPTGIEHGTVTVLKGTRHIEVTTFRKESDYLDGRRPSRVEFQDEIVEDLSRRDFTINAMAWDPVGPEFCDPFGGQLDLEARTIRCVGSALARFSEDGLRALRAVRFAAMLGFQLDPHTEAAIPQTLAVFRKVALERVKDELQKLLTSDRPKLGLSLLHSTGLLDEILPELPAPSRGLAFAVAAEVRPVLELRLAALLHPLEAARVKDVLRRLKFPNQVLDKVSAVLAHHRTEAVWAADDAGLRRFMAKVKREHLPEVLALEGARLAVVTPGGQGAFDAFRTRVERLAAGNPPLEPKDLALDGAAIMAALGIGPSRAVGEASRHLMDLVLADPSVNRPEELVVELRKWAKTKGI